MKVDWDPEVLNQLQETIESVVPNGDFHWKNKQVVHFYLPEQDSPWASILTKKADGLWLQLSGPKDGVTVGQVADLATAAEIATAESGDVIKMLFKDVEQVNSNKLKNFLEEHLDLVAD